MKRNEKIKEIKKERFFKKGDFIVYLFLCVLIIFLFVFFVFTANSEKVSYVTLSTSEKSGEVEILSYDFSSDELTVKEGYEDRLIISDTKTGYEIKFLSSDGGYNLIEIDKSGSVYVSEADCSFSKDCVSFSPIESGGQVIICVPHKLVIMGYSKGAEPPVVIG